jgi:hypothetical protein
MFTKRLAGSIYAVVGNCTPGKLLRTVVVDGDCVSLRIGSASVQVNNVEVVSRFRFRGKIHDFLPSHALEYQGHKLGDIVYFEETHIFCLDLKACG